MKHAIVVAHPNKDSFNAAVAASYQAATVAKGHTVVVRDLYQMQFDPRLPADELPGPQDHHAHADVVKERALLRDAQVFAFIYPLWLNAPPAILKGYWERVFGLGFAYGRNGSTTVPLLEGRKMVSFTSSGAPTDWVKSTGAWDAMRTLFDQHLAAVCGLQVVDHVHFGGIVPGIRKDAVERQLEAVAAFVETHF